MDGLATVGSIAVLVGPTTGHIYADNTWNTGLQWRLGSIGLGFGALVYAVSQCGLFGECSAEKESHVDAALVVFVGSMISYGAATIYDRDRAAFGAKVQPRVLEAARHADRPGRQWCAGRVARRYVLAFAGCRGGSAGVCLGESGVTVGAW